MKITTAFPSKYLRADDLGGREFKVLVDRVELEDVSGDGSEFKPVLYFSERKKGLVLNRTNSGVIAAVYGEETDAWSGRPVVLFPTQTQFQGRTVPCLRVRVPMHEAADDEPPF